MKLAAGPAECRIDEEGSLQWSFLPECIDPSCTMPSQTHGSTLRAEVGVRRCVSEARSSYPLITCDEEQEVYSLRKGFQERNMLFNGRYMCAVQEMVTEVINMGAHDHTLYSAQHNRTMCSNICLSEEFEMGELKVSESYTHTRGKVEVSKVFYRYEILKLI